MNPSNQDRTTLIAEASALLLERDEARDKARMAARIEAWRARSADHAEIWESAERLWRATGGEAVRPVRRTSLRRLVRRTGLPLAGATAAASIVAGYVLIDARVEGRVRTGVGETRQVALADGSQVTLDAGAVVIPNPGPNRGATLSKGRAYFAVAHDRSRPFHIKADAVDVEVTGTGFSVGRSDGVVTVDLAEGSVAVHTAGRAERLSPGERLIVDRSGAIRREAVSPAVVGAWRFGELAVEDATVDEVIAALRPHFRGVILDPPPALARQRVTGVFSLKDPVAALDGAVSPFGARVERLSPWVLRTVVEK
ncbi:FecR family protein [Brevundimonas sp.]|jgi:transmembrane sensor|uniref:FecR family protein n=1 Tax=Brevundimonas sp. TaxID=1871086 RepID=UPI0037BEC1B2